MVLTLQVVLQLRSDEIRVGTRLSDTNIADMFMIILMGRDYVSELR
jgi:hypothetical protein